ncbi:MAG: hypothetical protein ACW99A_14365, partial [Candidatus Kariarchaeaceae archaeon]
TQITVNVDGLLKDVYNYTLVVIDDSNNQVIDTAYVTVIDNTLPVFNGIPSNLQYDEGSTNNILTWNSTDAYPNTFTIYRNATQVDTGSWTIATQITLNVDGLLKGVYNFTIVVTDDSSNQAVDDVIVTVIDNTLPVFTSTPNDLQYNEESTGNILTWDSTDTYPNTYTIYQNGSQADTGSWISATQITLNVDGLFKGVYNYTIVVIDDSNNHAVDEVIVVVIDNTAPVFATTPSDLQYNEGSTSNTLTWNSTDVYPNAYSVYRNGSQVDTGSWTSPIQITLTVDGLLKGVYNYTIVVTDDSNNQVVDEVIVTVFDSTPPIFVSIPSNLQYDEGSTSNTLIWNSTDAYPNTYLIYRNGSQVDIGSWTRATQITLNVDGLLKGDYNYTIVVSDDSNNQVVDQVIVVVIDNTLPIFASTPSDLQYDEGSTSNTLTWNSTDVYPNTYSVYQNGTQVDTGSWISATQITVNVDGLLKGVYNYTIVVTDESNNQAVDTVYVNVIDNTLPVFTNIPSDLQYNEGATGNALTWNSTDVYPNTYTIYRNGTLVDTGSWTSANQITLNIDGLLKDVYNYTIIVVDDSNNKLADIVFVTVIDNTAPTYEFTDDFQYNEGTIGNTITWNATDAYPDTFVVYKDGVLTGYTGDWNNSGTIQINIDGLGKAIYNYTIIVYDTSGNQKADTVFVTVVDITAPSFGITPTDFDYNEESIGNTLTWNVMDIDPNNYTVYLNGSFTGDTGSWSNAVDITINIDGLAKGIYNFTIVVTDVSGNIVKDTAFVTVIDVTDPSFSSVPPDKPYSEGTSGNTLTWNATDKYPGLYQVFRDGSLTGDSGSWTNAGLILINIDGLAKGVYNYTIVVSDGSGNDVSDTVVVTVVDTTPPIYVNVPTDLQYSEGLSGNTLSWNATDNYPDTFVIYRNGSQIDTGSWTNAGLIHINIDGLAKGTYNYTILVTDLSGNQYSDTVYVTVIDDKRPEFVLLPLDIEYNETTIGHSLTWIATDKYAATYKVYRDGSFTGDSGSWTDLAFIIINLDGLVKGVYNYTIVVSDASGNEVSYTVSVTVKDVISPKIIIEADLTYFVEGTNGHELVWNVIDLHPGNYNLTRNGEVIAYTTWISDQNLSINVDSLEAGIYTFTIIFEDQSNNIVIDTIEVVVKDETLPEIISIDPSDDNPIFYEDIDGNLLSVEAFDLHPDKYNIYQDDNLVITGTWTNGNPIEWNIDHLVFGKYNIRFEFLDETSNKNTWTIIVDIQNSLIINTVELELDIVDEVYSGDLEYISGIWYDVNDKGVPNATILLQITNNNSSDFKALDWYFTTNVLGHYEIVFNYTSLSIGDYKWNVYFNKQGYANKTQELDVTILSHSFTIDVDFLATIIQGEEYPIAVKVSYENTRSDEYNSYQLGLLDYQPVADRSIDRSAEGINITINVQAKYEDGSIIDLGFSGITNENGVVVIILTEEMTRNMVSVESIVASISESSTGNSMSHIVSQVKLPNVESGDSRFIPQFTNYVVGYLLWIFLVALLAISLVVFYIYRSRKRLGQYKEDLEKITNGISEVKALLSIRGIIMRTPSGLPFYQEMFDTSSISPTLVAGLTSAISAFIDELGTSEKMGFEFIERQGMSLTSHNTDLCSIIIVSKEKLPDIILSQIELAHMYADSKFAKDILNRKYIKKKKLYNVFNKADFKIALRSKIKIDIRKAKRITRVKSVSLFIQNQISTLLDFVAESGKKQEDFQLEEIISYYEKLDIPHDEIVNIILAAYKHDVLKSIL